MRDAGPDIRNAKAEGSNPSCGTNKSGRFSLINAWTDWYICTRTAFTRTVLALPTPV